MDPEIIPKPLQSFVGIVGTIGVFSAVVAYAHLAKPETQIAPIVPPVEVVAPAESTRSEAVSEHVATVPESTESANEDFIARYENDLVGAEFLFGSFCASCHGAYGEVRTDLLLGSDLFNGEFSYGSEPEDLVSIISEGMLDQGMTPMKGLLDQTQIESLAAYILSKQPKP